MDLRQAEGADAKDEKDEVGDADALLGEGIVDDAVDVAMIETFDVDELFRECVVSLKARILVEALFVEPIMRLSRELIPMPVFAREQGRE